MDTEAHFDTRLIHAGEPRPRIDGAVVMPIFQTAQFEYAGESSYHDLKYIRLNNTPNHEVLHKKLAALEGAEAALVTASGMAAISTALLTVLGAGDHILAQDCLYGGTLALLTGDLPRYGITVDFIDAARPDSWKDKLRADTRAIYVETLTNPLVQVPCLPDVVAFARQHDLVSMIDNTFASPVNYRPPEHGFDLSLHSCTKYLNGHSDIVAGAVVGKRALVDKVGHKLDHLGGSLDPHACFLLQRGMKTLGLRMRHQNASTQRLASFLEQHPSVVRVHYPGLETSPDHARAREWLEGCGGVLSFEVKGGLAAANALIDRVRLPAPAPSLGGVETLITLPSATSHVGMSPDERRRLGIADGLIRLSVGLEDPDDLARDLDQALRA